MGDHRLDILAELADAIASRRGASPETSYTARLLSQGVEKCAKKLGEEAIEAALAAVTGDKPQVTAEAADLLYHLLVLLEATEVPLAAVMAELARRKAVSGIAEKASRRKD
ncbi:MAG: phosphoribosyl-ATP diphosphatase [Rhizobiales bacterium]|nr:phosphoribosyl-ATP diphosphatase [Hyphomicrobiales bacterium]MBI3673238.1 phosphoribosyl-ATP diphosphatase [Hyphomicrobiales bacterium]